MSNEDATEMTNPIESELIPQKGENKNPSIASKFTSREVRRMRRGKKYQPRFHVEPRKWSTLGVNHTKMNQMGFNILYG